MSTSGLNLASMGPAIILAIIAAISDWRSRRIPNPLILAGLVTAFSLAITFRGVDGLIFSLSGALVGFLLLLPGFLMRFTGAGDVKLLSMLGAFSGPSLILWVFVISAVAASLTVILRWTMRFEKGELASHARRYAKMFKTLWATGHFVYVSAPATSTLSQRMPMAPFVAFALLATVSHRLIQPGV